MSWYVIKLVKTKYLPIPITEINLLSSKRTFFWNGGFIGECRLRNEGLSILIGRVSVFIEIFSTWWILRLKKKIQRRKTWNNFFLSLKPPFSIEKFVKWNLLNHFWILIDLFHPIFPHFNKDYLIKF